MSRLLLNFYKARNNILSNSRFLMKNYSNENADQVTEDQIVAVLNKRFPSAILKVEDVSGGCGAMFNVFVETNEFKGLSIPKQHRKVYDALQEQIKNIHGLHLETKVAS